MEHIEEVMRKFTLSANEKEGVCLGLEDLEKGVKECRLSLIGRVWGDRTANITGMRSFATNVWPQLKNVKITEIKVNMFQFIFESRKDIELVLSKRPWIYDGQPLVLLEWQADLEEKEQAFCRTLMWVQIWNLPLHWVTKEAGRKIGGIFAGVREVIIPQGGGKEGKHLKILAEVNLKEPLPRGSMVKSNGGTRWIEFKYEKCPDFCFCCGLIGHNERICNRKGVDVDRENQYGNWLRASFPRSPRKKGRNDGDQETSGNGRYRYQSSDGETGSLPYPLLTYTNEFHRGQGKPDIESNEKANWGTATRGAKEKSGMGCRRVRGLVRIW
nr:uncharacterized protein LOC113728590 [Coffea arabica]